jgi:precorrin-2/cobalt-factor-2 C20-methyltransferase
MNTRTGKLYGVGVGPGDPELVTMKTVRILSEAQVIAYLAARAKPSNARRAIAAYLTSDHIEVPMFYPVTTEKLPPPFSYEDALTKFYDESAAGLAEHLDAGRDVVVLCEGDPFFYGSFMYYYHRLSDRYETEVVPGVCSVVASAAVLGAPLVHQTQTLSVISGVLSVEALTKKLHECDAAAIMKLGSNFSKVRGVLDALNLSSRALYVERATMEAQKVLPLSEVDPKTVPYFSMIIVPGRWNGR